MSNSYLQNTMFSGTSLLPSAYLYSFIVLKCLQEAGKLVFFSQLSMIYLKKDKHRNDIPSAINVECSLVPHSRNISCQLWVCENVCKYYMKTITRIQNGCSPIGIMVWLQKAFCPICLGLFVIYFFQNKAPTELFVHLGPYVCLPDILNVCQNSLGPAAI